MNRYTIREHKYESDSPMARLQELENKVEDGELFELPCKVGTEAYHLTSADARNELGVTEIFNGKVCAFSIEENGLWIFCRYDNGPDLWYTEREIGKILFFDQAEAETKLKGEDK